MFYPKGRLSDMGRVSAVLILFITIGSAFSEGLEFGINTAEYTADEMDFYLHMPDGQPTGVSVLFAKNDIGPVELYRGMYLWAASDRRLDTLFSVLPAGGRIICEEGYTPRWAIGWCSSTIDCGVPNNRPANLDAEQYFAEYFQALVRRYKPSGHYTTGQGISSWGLWNEPDGIGLMSVPSVSPETRDNGLDAYCRVAGRAATAIREADPFAEVVSGGFLSPASSFPTGQYWSASVKHDFQHMFSQESRGNLPVDYEWIAGSGEVSGPDALHWHPYDDMEIDRRLFCELEWWYDPLVIDQNDLMYGSRADDMADTYISSLFYGSQPDWSSMPQYLLEYCPSYSRYSWRNPLCHIVPAGEFFSPWRANYFITTNLLLAQSERIAVLAPAMPHDSCSGWWTGWGEGSGYSWTPVFFTPTVANPEYIGDIAFRFQISLLAGKHYIEPDPSIISITPSLNARIWTYSSAIGSGTVHAFRTFRTYVYDTTYNPDETHTISIEVSPGADLVNLYKMDGESLGSVPVSNGTASVPTCGYIRYAVEVSLDTPTETASIESDHRFSVHLTGSYLVVIAAQNSRVAVFDMAGRIVDTVETGELLSDGLSRLSCSTVGWPSACYLVHISSATGEAIGCEKVTVLQ